ncbi:phosphogluconate dehydrogenase (NAD(+)-dependent, decarboxylating) [Arthrobacter sp. YD2]|uniref:phosphogluconate dehydrogenase (NAD(+)-dependent, decarboxylating) n=1 Tax=Arthrobacter sp. YD2 TaxID=3058046 RepID=UPI0025B402A4|nr:decarboxylating 6-phosphogluconate dehydrogenase [Arthrobacter sp. YD2]MDN3903084.1 decarboxylating 6-phosphogluconate dehydrogenase [Arthrobacter sp. YD2]
MHIGLIGLGKMGFGMRERLRRNNVDVTGFDRDPVHSDVSSLTELVDELPVPRIVWVMVPAGDSTAGTITALSEVLSPGDLVIDGGNSRFTDDSESARILGNRGIRFLDCGVSGGIRGRDEGYALMVGGDADDVQRAMPLFDALRPDGERGDSFVHAGKTGAGHYAKMVHNGIEYGLMQSYAEGYELLAGQDVVDDVPGILAAWQHGTVVRSWLLELAVQALQEDPDLAGVGGHIEDSGEGRWAVEEAVARGIPAPAITAALYARFASRQQDAPALRMVAALRRQFGGHEVRRPEHGGSDAG